MGVVHGVVGINYSLPEQLLRLSSISSMLYEEDVGSRATEFECGQPIFVSGVVAEQDLYSLAVPCEHWRLVRVSPSLPHICW